MVIEVFRCVSSVWVVVRQLMVVVSMVISGVLSIRFYSRWFIILLLFFFLFRQSGILVCLRFRVIIVSVLQISRKYRWFSEVENLWLLRLLNMISVIISGIISLMFIRQQCIVFVMWLCGQLKWVINSLFGWVKVVQIIIIYSKGIVVVILLLIVIVSGNGQVDCRLQLSVIYSIGSGEVISIDQKIVCSVSQK